jgi:tetratricopeptide (TPR) repeat protein
VRLAALLERTLRGVYQPRQQSTPAILFRRADQCRNAGQYDEAARLVAQGLRQAPDSSVGHLISAYLHMARRQASRAKHEFDRVLALDPYHPRALLGLARIHIEEQDLEGAKVLLDRALQYYADFPEARALREMLVGSTPTQADRRAAPPSSSSGAPSPSAHERDVVAVRTDGKLVLTRTEEDRGRQLAQHVMQVYRTASATLSRAGLGSLRCAAIDTGSFMTFLLTDADLVYSATLDGKVDVAAGFARIRRLRTDLGIKG